MTIILYSKGCLAADSRSLLDTDESSSLDYFIATKSVKLKTLARNIFAVAVCGSVPTQSDWLEMERIFLRSIIASEFSSLKQTQEQVYLNEKEAEALRCDQRYYIVMTKHHVYQTDKSKVGYACAFERVDLKAVIAKGTGARIARMALEYGQTVSQAVKLAIDVESTCGGPILAVHQEQLVKIKELKC